MLSGLAEIYLLSIIYYLLIKEYVMSWRTWGGCIRLVSILALVFLQGCGRDKSTPVEAINARGSTAETIVVSASIQSALVRLRAAKTEDPYVIFIHQPSQKYVQFFQEHGGLIYNFPLASATVSPGEGPYLFSGAFSQPPDLDVNASHLKHFMNAEETARLSVVLKEAGLSDRATFSVGTNEQGVRVGWMKDITGEFTGTDHDAEVLIDRVFREVFLIGRDYAVTIEEN